MEKDIVKDFGRTVRHFRNALNISQETLADKSGFHRTYIGQIERGERNPSLKNIETFARTFDISLTQMFQFCENLES